MTTEDRPAYTTGLRMLADVLDANPEIPLPFEGRLAPVGWFLHGDEQRDELAAIARAFPCNWEKGVWGKNDDGFILTGRLAGLDIAAHATRDQVCTRVVTGTEDREVEEVVTPAVVRKVTKPVEVVEWQCQPLLATVASDMTDAAIEADPAGVADAVIAAVRKPARVDLGDDPDGDNTPEAVLAPYVFPGTGPRCRAIDSDQFICTAAPGHDGNHAAYAPDGELYATWPQDPPVPSSGPASLADALKASLADVPVPSSGPLCAKCHSPGPLKTRGNGMQVCEDTGACGRRWQAAQVQADV